MRFIGNTMFAGTTNGVYRSTNFGVAWSPSNTGMTGVEVDFIAIQDTATLFASSRDSGMYVSTNNGQTWLASNAGLPTLRLRGVRSTGTHLYVATVGHGVWRRPVGEVITDVREGGGTRFPAEFMLHQNYPNPFNPSTNIRFSIPVGTHGRVSLQVYDILGREVATLVNELKGTGSYEVTWDATGMASGVYFYRLQAGEFMQSKRLLLLR
ncbi:MAG: T9SS type A sorting domain-containing protein [Bacteroidetes bacterium]|nr:T9SS type A sorting domain-containing protein [Bacteroidota bacterium]MCW5894407.1 T9SS type A sorting domain-containing protein [Bacteroidota bacterium]